MSEVHEFDWVGWKRLDGSKAANLLEQLKTEVGSRHQLWNCLHRTEVLAKDSASDDILIEISGDTGFALFVVHLTWSQAAEADGDFPSVTELSISAVPRELRSEN